MLKSLSKSLPQTKIAMLAMMSVLPLALAAQPAAAATKQEKMETCKVGADHDNLTGAKRDAFMKKCMGAGNYEPKARQDALKQAKSKKPAATPTAAPAPAADEQPEEKAQ